jgi:hypothetical protein
VYIYTKSPCARDIFVTNKSKLALCLKDKKKRATNGRGEPA